MDEKPFFAAPLPLDAGERLIATFTPSLAAYWRAHAIMALGAGVLAGLALVYAGNPHPWVGPLAAVLAVGIRAAYVKSEAMAEEWRLTNLRLLGPGGRAASLSSLTAVRPFFGAVQVVTKNDKHLIKYQHNPAATVAAIQAVHP
jgi:hypothetical protein